jgi:hypothetical protein
MKDRATSVLVSSSSGLATVMAGARWWAVVLAIFVVLVMTYGTVVWLATHSPATRITTLLLTWERDPNPPPQMPQIE